MGQDKDKDLFTLIVEVSNDKLPLQILSGAVEKLRLLLNELYRGTGVKLQKTTWVATNLSMGSPARVKISAANTPHDFDALHLTGTTIDGFAELSVAAKKPDGWSDQALKYGRDICELADPEWVTGIHLENGQKSASMVSEVISHVDLLTAPKYKDSEGSIDGRLDLVNVHEGFELGIYTTLGDRKIPASFEKTDDKTLDKVRSLLKRRVYATGTISWQEDGKPKSILIKKVEPLERDPKRKGIFDLNGSDPEFTEGLSVEEFLRRKRGD